MRIVDRPGYAVAKLRDAIGMTGDAAFALAPVARRQIEQRLGQAVRLQPRGDFRRGKFIGAEIFDAAKSGLGRRLEAIEKGVFGEQHREIG